MTATTIHGIGPSLGQDNIDKGVDALLLGCAVRFVHFALFGGTLLSPASYAADAIYLLIVSAFGWRHTRAAQMATQYY